MVLGHRVETLLPRLTARLGGALTPATRGPADGCGFFSDTFISRHTDFDSVDEFCQACPAGQESVGGVQRLGADEREAFVAARTDFESWAEMKRSAAMTDLVTLHTA